MRIRWLGWAGVEVEAEDERVVVDPLKDAGAVFAWMGDKAATLPRPEVVAPRDDAVAGLVTHLHRDHTDADALAAALSPKAPVFEPQGYGGTPLEQLGIAQADQELTTAGLPRRPTSPWTSAGKRVLHLGDTMFHGWWWRFTERFGAPDVVLAPINGARLTFPHRQPASPLAGAMDPEQAALAAELLQAEQLVPIHYGGYGVPGLYEPVQDALGRLKSASNRVTTLDLGESIEV